MATRRTVASWIRPDSSPTPRELPHDQWSRASSANRHRRRRLVARVCPRARRSRPSSGVGASRPTRSVPATCSTGPSPRSTGSSPARSRIGAAPDTVLVTEPHGTARTSIRDEPDRDARRSAPEARRSRPSRVPTAEPDPDAQGPARPDDVRHRRRTTRRSSPTSSRTPGARRPASRWSWRPRPRQHVARVPARAPGPGPRMGEPQGQPQRRLGAVGDGPRARGVRGDGLRGPRLQDPPGRPARCGQGDQERPTRRSSCWPGAARTPG